MSVSTVRLSVVSFFCSLLFPFLLSPQNRVIPGSTVYHPLLTGLTPDDDVFAAMFGPLPDSRSYADHGLCATYSCF